jgi:pimeloyl-ACP methyl ester carboxylesterase
MNNSPPEHFLVLIPGYMGSRLRSRSTGELVWLDLTKLSVDPHHIHDSLQQLFDRLHYPNDDLVPDGIVNQIVYLPPLFKQEQYSRLLEALAAWGYAVSPEQAGTNKPPVYTFAYDWRQDNRLSAKQLAQAIQIWESRHPGAQAWIIGHSNGGIVARWYIEKEGGNEHVGRLFLIGSPWDGAPKTIQVLQNGVDVFLVNLFNSFGVQQLLRQAVRTFPSFYQLIPSHLPFLRDGHSQTIDPFKDPRWLETRQQRQLLEDAQNFNRALGTKLNVETLCFFGVKQPTTTNGVVELSPDGKYQAISWERNEDGDGTVPVHSALHPTATQKLPFTAEHGDLYVAPALLDKLEYELVNRYRYGALAMAATSQIKAQFEVDQEAYCPGQPIQLWVTLQQQETGVPVFGARLNARLEWRQSLPGTITRPAEDSPSTWLQEASQSPGRYEATIPASGVPGYYRMRVSISPKNEPPVEVEELILIEGNPKKLKGL